MAPLNGDILEEVFSKLSAKAIIRYKSVCKDAKSYPSENFFVKKHCKCRLENGDSGILLVHPGYDQVQLFSSDSSDGSRNFGMPWESVKFLSSTVSIVASSNGLVCGLVIKDHEVSFFICNPVTKTWVLLPLPDGWRSDGWHSGYSQIKVVFECVNIEDYLLIITTATADGVWFDNRHLMKIYSPKEGLWKEGGYIDIGSRNMYGKPVYVRSNSGGGAVYYKSDSGPYLMKINPYYWPYIVRYDIETSVSQILKIPREARKGVIEENKCMLDIFKFYGLEPTICLIKMRRTVFSVWVLDRELKWKMVLKKPAWVMGICEPNLNVAGFTVINGNLLVIATAERIYRYNLLGDLSNEKARKICSYGCGERNVALLPYSNTLRPCGDGAMPLPV